MAKVKDITGKKFGRLTVNRLSRSNGNTTYWNCVCECGKEKEVGKSNLTNGSTLSCGCLHSELSSKRLITHGNFVGNKPTKEFSTWSSMKARCNYVCVNGYERYGGRGIEVCERWKNSFENFLEDMGKSPTSRHSIDRIDVNGDYSPDNCKWASSEEQSRNKRTFKNNKSGFNGVMWHKINKKWVSSIAVHGKRIHLGYFNNIEEAVDARKNGEIKYWGKTS